MLGNHQTSYHSNGQWQYGTSTEQMQSNTGSSGYGNYVRMKYNPL
jgi:hypothetical protein